MNGMHKGNSNDKQSMHFGPKNTEEYRKSVLRKWGQTSLYSKIRLIWGMKKQLMSWMESVLEFHSFDSELYFRNC